MAQNRGRIFVRNVDLSDLLTYLEKINLGRQRGKIAVTPPTTVTFNFFI